MRLITHTDLDGAMCAVLITSVEDVVEIKFVDPATVQAGKMPVHKYDIIADLPFDKRCGMWFDHHESSKPPEGRTFEGEWKLAPSAARVVFDYYENPYLEKFAAAVDATDKIDSGNVPKEEVGHPTGWFLFSNTLEMEPDKAVDDDYRKYVIELLKKKQDIGEILRDERVAGRADRVKEEFEKFAAILKECTLMVGKVAYSDLRKRNDLPRGNNYIVYALFPDAVSSVRLMPENEEKGMVKLSVGHNIYGKKSSFDVGAAMKKIGGGGHRPVGGARLSSEDAEAIAKRIVAEINEWEASHP